VELFNGLQEFGRFVIEDDFPLYFNPDIRFNFHKVLKGSLDFRPGGRFFFVA
jgi:hypothetical protein